MMVISQNSRASVEGLPLQLIITAVVLAITIPLMFGALQTYDKSKVENEIRSEIDEFISTVQLVYVSGPGNRAVIEFHVSNGAFTGIDYLKFGDEPGGNNYSVIRYRINGMQEVSTVLKSPNVPMISVEGNELTLMPGQYEIIVECLTHETDLNGDGLAPDNFIQLSLSST